MMDEKALAFGDMVMKHAMAGHKIARSIPNPDAKTRKMRKLFSEIIDLQRKESEREAMSDEDNNDK